MSHHKVIILGSGPAGLTAAIYTARANLSPLLIHGPLPGGQLTTTTDVENFPGFPEGVMGPDLMASMEKQAVRFGTEIIVDTVTKISVENGKKTLTTHGKEYTCDALIIATGASAKKIGIPSETELMGYGVSTCATCDGAFFRGKPMAVLGGGDSACEEASFLTRFASKVYLIHRRDELRASKIMAERVLHNEKIEAVWDSEVLEILGSRADGVRGIKIKNKKTSTERIIDLEAVFVAIGHTPNSNLLSGIIDLDPSGYIITKPSSSKTSREGIFACGDVQDSHYRQAITAAGSGCMAAIDVERWLEEKHL